MRFSAPFVSGWRAPGFWVGVVRGKRLWGGMPYVAQQPNPPMQLTPLRVPEIGAFLKVRIGSDVIPIDGWRRN